MHRYVHKVSLKFIRTQDFYLHKKVCPYFVALISATLKVSVVIRIVVKSLIEVQQVNANRDSRQLWTNTRNSCT